MSLPDFVVFPIAVGLFGYVVVSVIAGFALGQFFKARDSGVQKVNHQEFSQSLLSIQRALGSSTPAQPGVADSRSSEAVGDVSLIEVSRMR